nr:MULTISPECIES: transposase [unclassified Mesorhizobium]
MTTLWPIRPVRLNALRPQLKSRTEAPTFLIRRPLLLALKGAVVAYNTCKLDALRERFQLYVDKVLVPTLEPGDIVIMDNLGSHKGKAVRRAIRSAGARLFLLPKYSPDLNPSEKIVEAWHYRSALAVTSERSPSDGERTDVHRFARSGKPHVGL